MTTASIVGEAFRLVVGGFQFDALGTQLAVLQHLARDAVEIDVAGGDDVLAGERRHVAGAHAARADRGHIHPLASAGADRPLRRRASGQHRPGRCCDAAGEDCPA